VTILKKFRNIKELPGMLVLFFQVWGSVLYSMQKNEHCSSPIIIAKVTLVRHKGSI